MKLGHIDTTHLQQVLEQRQSELVLALRERNAITIEKSADQMDEIQYATERDLAIRNADNDSNLLRLVRGALIRIRNGEYGTCIECNEAISAKRLAAVPWTPRCIQCQDLEDRGRQGTPHFATDTSASAA